MPRSRRLLLPLALASLLALAAAMPAQAAIHEIVASWCSGVRNDAVINPPGQTRFGSQSFLRALQASGVYDIQFGAAPADAPAPFPDTVPVTIEMDLSRPNVKAVPLGGWFVFPVMEGDLALTVYLTAFALDHPAFERCPNMPPLF